MGCRASAENKDTELSAEELDELQRQRALARFQAMEAATVQEAEPEVVEEPVQEESPPAPPTPEPRELPEPSPRSPTPELPSEPETPEDLGPRMIPEFTPERYQRLTQLSHNTECSTWLARDVETGRKFALRVYSLDQLDQIPNAYANLKADVNLAKSLDHPNLTKVYGFVDNREAREAWVVMEYTPGETLAEFIAKFGKFGEVRARNYLRQLLLAVQYLHHHGIAHRDLKPELVVVQRGKNNKDVLKISDFGTGDLSYTQDQQRVNPGASVPYHVAPEVLTPDLSEALARAGYTGFASDVWSLGSILYNMIYGTPAFHGKGLQQLLNNIRNAKYSFPREDPTSMGARKCMKGVMVPRIGLRPTLDELAADPWVCRGGFPDYIPDPVCTEASGTFERTCCAKHAKQLAKIHEEQEKKLEERPIVFGSATGSAPNSPTTSPVRRRSSVSSTYQRVASYSPARSTATTRPRRNSVASLTFATAMAKLESNRILEERKVSGSPAPPRRQSRSQSAAPPQRGTMSLPFSSPSPPPEGRASTRHVDGAADWTGRRASYEYTGRVEAF